jgi:hypothetical protein
MTEADARPLTTRSRLVLAAGSGHYVDPVHSGLT